MRLPCDAALLVIDAGEVLDDPGRAPNGSAGAAALVAELVAAWSVEALPVFDIRRDPAGPVAADRPQRLRDHEASEAPADEIEIDQSVEGAFADGRLEEALDEIGATTLVVCGALTGKRLEASVREGGRRGYRIFVVGEACWALDARDPSGRPRPAAEIHAHSLAAMRAQDAQIVTGAMALQAAGMANARRRKQR